MINCLYSLTLNQAYHKDLSLGHYQNLIYINNLSDGLTANARHGICETSLQTMFPFFCSRLYKLKSVCYCTENTYLCISTALTTVKNTLKIAHCILNTTWAQSHTRKYEIVICMFLTVRKLNLSKRQVFLEALIENKAFYFSKRALCMVSD